MFKRKGFTLVEILLVIVIIGILAAIVIPRVTYSKKTAQEQACRANIATLNSQIELYKLNTGNYPPLTAALDTTNLFWTNNDTFPDNYPTCPVSGTSQLNYSIDATKNRVILSTHLTAAGHN